MPPRPKMQSPGLLELYEAKERNREKRKQEIAAAVARLPFKGKRAENLIKLLDHISYLTSLKMRPCFAGIPQFAAHLKVSERTVDSLLADARRFDLVATMQRNREALRALNGQAIQDLASGRIDPTEVPNLRFRKRRNDGGIALPEAQKSPQNCASGSANLRSAFNGLEVKEKEYSSPLPPGVEADRWEGVGERLEALNVGAIETTLAAIKGKGTPAEALVALEVWLSEEPKLAKMPSLIVYRLKAWDWPAKQADASAAAQKREAAKQAKKFLVRELSVSALRKLHGEVLSNDEQQKHPLGQELDDEIALRLFAAHLAKRPTSPPAGKQTQWPGGSSKPFGFQS